MGNYRITKARAVGMHSRDIIEEVVFSIAEDIPDFSDDLAVKVTFNQLNPILSATFSAWMCGGFIASGGLYSIYDSCSSEIIQRAPHGFRLLSKPDIAYAIELSWRAFTNGIIPISIAAKRKALDDWSEKIESNLESPEQQSISGLEYQFDITDTYAYTDHLLKQYHSEFIKP